MFEALDTTSAGVPVDYNVAPTDPVPVIRNSQRLQRRVLAVARWGLMLAWSADRRAGARMINARAETVATTRAFARPFATRRCLIPADGWYEFAAPAGPGMRKQPFFMTRYDEQPVVFGGIWSMWSPPDGSAESVLTCSIVTTAARGSLQVVHDRMPLVLSRSRWDGWLGSTSDEKALLASPSDADVEEIEIRPVGPAVGDVRSDGPDLVTRVRIEPPPADLTLF